MLDLTDVIELPPGVRHEPGRIVDDVCEASHPTNVTADAILALGPVRLADAADLLVERFCLEVEDARHDVLAFAYALNAAGLVNVGRGGLGARLMVGLRLLVLGLLVGRVPGAPIRRLPLRTTGRSRGVPGVVAALAPRAAGVTAAGLALLLACGMLIGVGAPGVALLVAVSMAASLVLHEAAHVAFLAPRPCALLLTGPRTSVIHAPVPERTAVAVALAGPVLLGLLGLGLAAWSLHAASFAVLLAACPPAGHALGTTVASLDGRRACGLESR